MQDPAQSSLLDAASRYDQPLANVTSTEKATVFRPKPIERFLLIEIQRRLRRLPRINCCHSKVHMGTSLYRYLSFCILPYSI
jgi:hypothetical protein